MFAYLVFVMKKFSNFDLGYVHLAVLLFGLAGLFGKWIVLPATIIVLGRVFFASLFLGPILFAKNQRVFLSGKEYNKFIVLGAILSVHWVSFFYSIQISTVAVGLLSFSSFPIFTTFLEPKILGGKLPLKSVFLSLLTFCGLVLVVPEFNLENNVTQGVLWGVLSGLTFALLSILNKKYVANYTSAEVAFHQDVNAFIFLIPFLLIEEVNWSLDAIILLAILGVVFTAVAHTLFIEGMKTVRATTASIIASLEPVYGILFAMVFFTEYPSIEQVFGGVIILGTSLYSSLRS